MEEIRRIIDKYFKDDRTIFYHLSDFHQNEEPNFYLRYQYSHGRVLLFCGSDNGEVCIFETDYQAEKLESVIKAILNQ